MPAGRPGNPTVRPQAVHTVLFTGGMINGMQAQQVELGAALDWYACGWRLFRRFPLVWIIMFLLLLGLNLVLALVPVVGQLALVLLAPVFLGGLYLAASTVEENGQLSVGMLFRGFGEKAKTTPLLMLGGAMLAATIVLTLIAWSLIGGSLLTGFVSGNNVTATISAGVGAVLGSLVLLLLQAVIVMVIVYAVPLVMLDEAPPIEALKSSLNACIVNVAPFLIFGVIYLVLAFLAAIPFFLGYLLLLPITLCAAFCSYKHVFHS